MLRPVALITGPTSGVGEGYVRRDTRGARDVDRVTDLAGDVVSQSLADLPNGTVALVIDGQLISRGLTRVVVKRVGGGRGRN